MPEIVTCPDAECGKKLRVPDNLLGKKVKCPGCSRLFLAKGPAALEEELPEEEAPARATKAKPRAAGRKTEEEEDSKKEAVTTAPARRSPKKEEVLDELEEDEKATRAKPSRRARDEDEDEDTPRSRRRSRDDDDDEDEDAPRKKRSRRDGDDDEDSSPRRSRKSARDGLRAARTGINLAILGGWLLLAVIGVASIGLGLMVLIGGSMLVGIGGGIGGGDPGRAFGSTAGGMVGMGLVMILLGIVLGLMLLGELILRLTGYGMCMMTPPQGPSRVLAIVAFSCACAALVISLAGNAFGGVQVRGVGFLGVGDTVGGLAWLLAFASWVSWMIYLYNVSVMVKDAEAAAAVMRVGIAYGIHMGVGVLIVIAQVIFVAGFLFSAVSGTATPGSVAGAGVSVIIFGILWVCLALAWVALYVWYLLVMQKVRDAVGYAASRA